MAVSRKNQKKRLQALQRKFLRRDYSTSRAWNRKELARLTTQLLKKNTSKDKPKKAVDTFDKKKKDDHVPDYAGNIRNMYENSMASEASLNGLYYGQY